MYFTKLGAFEHWDDCNSACSEVIDELILFSTFFNRKNKMKEFIATMHKYCFTKAYLIWKKQKLQNLIILVFWTEDSGEENDIMSFQTSHWAMFAAALQLKTSQISSKCLGVVAAYSITHLDLFHMYTTNNLVCGCPYWLGCWWWLGCSIGRHESRAPSHLFLLS